MYRIDKKAPTLRLESLEDVSEARLRGPDAKLAPPLAPTLECDRRINSGHIHGRANHRGKV